MLYIFLISILIRLLISLKTFTVSYNDLRHSIKQIENNPNPNIQEELTELTKRFEEVSSLHHEHRLMVVDEVFLKVNSVKIELKKENYKKLSPLFDKRYRLFLDTLITNNQ